MQFQITGTPYHQLDMMMKKTMMMMMMMMMLMLMLMMMMMMMMMMLLMLMLMKNKKKNKKKKKTQTKHDDDKDYKHFPKIMNLLVISDTFDIYISMCDHGMNPECGHGAGWS